MSKLLGQILRNMSHPTGPSADPTTLSLDYWGESRQPLASLAFILPLLAAYEVGVVALGPKAVRNGADVWLRGFLERLDFGQYFLLPVLVIGILLGWHHTTHRGWRVSRRVLWTMAGESAAMAVCLWMISLIQASAMRSAVGSFFVAVPAAAAARPTTSLAGYVGFLGAGVYEELLFRLMLLPAVEFIILKLGAARIAAAVTSVVFTSVLFAAAHYVGRYGEPIVFSNFNFWYAAIFRVLAGVFFGALFVSRGFGIAAGSHAAYDILVRLC